MENVGIFCKRKKRGGMNMYLFWTILLSSKVGGGRCLSLLGSCNPNQLYSFSNQRGFFLCHIIWFFDFFLSFIPCSIQSDKSKVYITSIFNYIILRHIHLLFFFSLVCQIMFSMPNWHDTINMSMTKNIHTLSLYTCICIYIGH